MLEVAGLTPYLCKSSQISETLLTRIEKNRPKMAHRLNGLDLLFDRRGEYQHGPSFKGVSSRKTPSERYLPARESDTVRRKY
jgi:hypothetical protein